MTWPIVELTFWNPGDPRSDAVDALLADPRTPLAKHGLTGIAAAYSRETGAVLHQDHRAWTEHLVGRSLGVDGALRDVVALFDERGFDYFVAKGPVIAHTVYPDAGMRPYCDLDVYIGHACHEAAREVLRGAGYEPVQHGAGVLGGLAQELHGGRFGATVELHAHVIDNVHRRHLPAVERFQPFVECREIAGVAVPVLGDGAHLALQAIHAGAGHRYAKLVLLRDIDAALRLTSRAHPGLGGEVYLSAATRVLTTMGRTTSEIERRGTLPALVASSRKGSDPASWDEYRLSAANVIAFLHHERWSDSASAACATSLSALPRRDRRVRVKRSLRAPEPQRVSPQHANSQRLQAEMHDLKGTIT